MGCCWRTPTAFKSQELTQEQFCFKQQRSRLCLPKFWGTNCLGSGEGIGKTVFFACATKSCVPAQAGYNAARIDVVQWGDQTLGHFREFCMCLGCRCILTHSCLLFTVSHVPHKFFKFYCESCWNQHLHTCAIQRKGPLLQLCHLKSKAI